MSVIASMEKSTAWNQSGFAFVYGDVEKGKSDRVTLTTYLHRELTSPAIDFACGAWQQWSLPCDCSDTRDRVIKTIKELCLIVSEDTANGNQRVIPATVRFKINA